MVKIFLVARRLWGRRAVLLSPGRAGSADWLISQ
jgi:hypothetical protein